MPELTYRIVCYELEGDSETVILDTTARAFIAVTGTLDENGTMHGKGTHAGPLPLLKRIARLMPTTSNSPADRLQRAPTRAVPVGSIRRSAYRSPQSTSEHREQPMSPHTPAHNVIVQIKVKLLGVSKPPVWRQLQLRADTRLDQLHEILQAALGWENYHMHVFSFGDEEFGVPDPELGFADERKVTLGELTDIGARFRYTYDFGDDWQHEILVEDLLDPDPDVHYPILVAAKGACPPEDCGSAWGYSNLKEILADPSHDEHQQMLEWLGLNDASEFDPNAVPTQNIDYELALSSASH